MNQKTLPTINDTPTKPKAKQKQAPVEVPASEAYSRTLRHVASLSIKRVPMKHRVILSQKIRDLQDVGARLADGTVVTDKTKAFLWIVENEVKV